MSDVDTALRRAAVRLCDVELFAAAAGPGSFTGLRAGLATVKAFAATLGRPAFGVQTLHAVAYAARPAERLIALLPAGRGEVFAQLLSVTDEGEVRELERPAHVGPAALLEFALSLEGGVKWAGSGARLLEGEILAAARKAGIVCGHGPPAAAGVGRAWALAPETGALSPHVAALALKEYGRGQIPTARDVRAIYVRASDAELNEPCRAPELPRRGPSNTSSTG